MSHQIQALMIVMMTTWMVLTQTPLHRMPSTLRAATTPVRCSQTPMTMLESNDDNDEVRLLQQGPMVGEHQDEEDEQVVMTEDQSDVDDCVSVVSSSSLTNFAAIGADIYCLQQHLNSHHPT